jgi:ubiquinone/menaquinone biosynthesis C-methylase UbiE
MGRNEETRSIKEGQQAAWEKAYRQEHPRWRGPSDLKMDRLGGKVLELGCGDGKTAIRLAEAGLSVTGLDRSRAALLTLSRRIGSGKLELVQGDALDLPFKDGAFDSVTSVHFIDHLLSADRRNAVDEIGRVLRQSGVVVGRFFSVNDMRFGKGKDVEHGTYLKGNGVINHYFSEAEILDLFAGYDVLSIEASRRETKFSGGSDHRSWITAELRKR